MWYDALIKQHMKAVEVVFFKDDPENDANRAGDGWYFRFAGEQEGWSGAWGWKGEALAEAQAAIERRYHEIEMPRSFFKKRAPKGYSYFLATGTCGIRTLGYYPYELYWEQPAKAGQCVFSLLVAAPTLQGALKNASWRVGHDAVFTALKKVEGKLSRICKDYNLQDPVDLAIEHAKTSLAG